MIRYGTGGMMQESGKGVQVENVYIFSMIVRVLTNAKVEDRNVKQRKRQVHE